MKYVLDEVVKLARSMKARHRMWKTDNKLNDDDAGVYAHCVMSEILDYWIEFDQYDITNSAAAERVFRWLQFIEEGQRQKLER